MRYKRLVWAPRLANTHRSEACFIFNFLCRGSIVAIDTAVPRRPEPFPRSGSGTSGMDPNTMDPGVEGVAGVTEVTRAPRPLPYP
jgi:hypothetical protein